MARVQRCLTAFAFLISACGLIYDTSRLGPDRTSNADGGGDGSDAKPPRFCETLTPKVHFCADFDDGDIEEGWASFGLNRDPGIRNGGSIEPDTNRDQSKDGTRGVLFNLPQAADGDRAATAYLLKTFKVAEPAALPMSP
jgi:hypothetical protein